MRTVMVVLITAFLGGCVAGGEPARKHRWPEHRTNHDQQLDELQRRVSVLEQQLAEVRAYVAKLHVKKATAEAPPAPTPPTPPTAPTSPQPSNGVRPIPF